MPEVVEFSALNPNNSNGIGAGRNLWKIKKYSAGMRPRAFQFDSAGKPTPVSSATAALPPAASMMSSTVQSIRLNNSRNMKLSSVHISGVDNTQIVKFNPASGTVESVLMRNLVAARLRRLPALLGKSDSEFAGICGVETSTWSNWKSPKASRNEIPPECALQLFYVCGIPMEWIYGGDASRAADLDLRVKLHQAERDALAEITPAPRPRPRGGRFVVLMTIGTLFAMASGPGRNGERPGTHWERTDGAPIRFARLLSAEDVCRAEAKKLIPVGDDATGGLAAPYFGCMADRGYIHEKE